LIFCSRKASRDLGAFASRFVKEAKEQMGAEVFILVGYQDEKGEIQKAK
jgi:hypothetical protein